MLLTIVRSAEPVWFFVGRAAKAKRKFSGCDANMSTSSTEEKMCLMVLDVPLRRKCVRRERDSL